MNVDNKPLDSDAEFLQEFEIEQPEEKQEKKDVDDTKEFLTKVSAISGREFKTIEEYEKHYKNLASFVGKKIEPEKVEQPQTPDKKDDGGIALVSENLKKIEFFMENPEAKKHFDEYVKPLADGSGISYKDAWAKVQPLVQSSEEQENEKEIGVNSKNRIMPVDNSKLNELAQKARTGNAKAQEDLVAKMLGLEK